MAINTDVAYSLVTLRGKVDIIYLFILIAFSGSDIVYFGEIKHCAKFVTDLRQVETFQ